MEIKWKQVERYIIYKEKYKSFKINKKVMWKINCRRKKVWEKNIFQKKYKKIKTKVLHQSRFTK